MSEPTNPLFEEEKAFLERKKLEYERALRGDLAQLKQQTTDAGRVALVGAGLAGSIWLITKAFSSRKKKRPEREDYDAGYYGPDDYPTQHFGDYDPYDEDNAAYPQERSHWRYDVDTEVNDYFAEPHRDDEHGTVYHSDTDRYDTPSADADDDFDDNGLHDYPSFPAHSDRGHDEAAPETEHFGSEAYGHPESPLPFDDSRRLPESEDFAATEEFTKDGGDDEPTHSDDTAGDLHRIITGTDYHTDHSHGQPKQNLGAMLVGLARTDLGKVIVGQAASLAIAMATKVIKAKLMHNEPETLKTSDLADLTDQADGYAHGHPATPQPDAHHSSADASHF